MENYGKELILDIHECDPSTFTRASIRKFCTRLCNLIDMETEDLHFWDYDGDPEAYEEAPDHLKGISCVQFIKTSSIVIHTLDVLEKIFINIFSCKNFNDYEVKKFALEWFKGTLVKFTPLERV